jgi:transposase
VARPTALTPEVSRVICVAIRSGHYREVAAKRAGIHRDTLHTWERRGETGEEPYAEFSDAIKKAEAYAEAKLLRMIRKRFEGWQACAWVLERRFPQRWSGRVRSHVNDELDALTAKLKRSLDAETFAKVIDATREEAPSADAAPPRH